MSLTKRLRPTWPKLAHNWAMCCVPSNLDDLRCSANEIQAGSRNFPIFSDCKSESEARAHWLTTTDPERDLVTPPRFVQWTEKQRLN